VARHNQNGIDANEVIVTRRIGHYDFEIEAAPGGVEDPSKRIRQQGLV